MGLMISSIAKIGNSILPKNMFNANSDYYLYILEYSDFDFQEPHNYSLELHSSGMSRILNNYQYNFENVNFEKLESKTFHGETIMTWETIFDIHNDTQQTKITPAFLFTTIQPDILNKVNSDNISNDKFILLKIRPQDRDANKIPQLVNEMLSSTGLTISKCKQSSVKSAYTNVYVFDYCSETTTTKIVEIKTEIIMGDKIEVRDIFNNNGKINVGKNIKTKTEVNGNDKFAGQDDTANRQF
jgi:hypothetical protein